MCESVQQKLGHTIISAVLDVVPLYRPSIKDNGIFDSKSAKMGPQKKEKKIRMSVMNIPLMQLRGLQKV